MTRPPLSGQCLCGSVRFTIAGPLVSTGLCHCLQCRRGVGASPVAWATFRRDGLTLQADDVGWFQSSPPARRDFCRRCGASIFFESETDPEVFDVTIATLDQADEVVPAHHTWTSSKQAWASTNDGLPVYGRDEPYQR